jgi:hypothetical protein
MVEKPSDITNKKESKLTRRRAMKLAAAAGFPSAAALSMTPEDVKAAASDQVTIPFDTEGNYKIQVDADMFDHYIRTKDVRKEIEQEFQGRKGISGFSIKRERNDLHYVMVYLDSESKKKEERRGEIPEYKNDIRIAVDDNPSSIRVTHTDEDGNCIRHRGCDDEIRDSRNFGGFEDLPGGVRSRAWGSNGFCTNGPRFINGSKQDFDFGWSIAAHCLDCGTDEGSVPIEHDDSTTDSLLRVYGEPVLIDRNIDIAYIEPRNNSTPASEIVLPSNHNDTIHISGTLAESSWSTVLNNSDHPATLRGINHCETGAYTINDQDRTLNNGDPNYDCVDQFTNQFVVQCDNDHPWPGDSGGVPYIPGPEGKYFAVGSLTGMSCGQDLYVGGQGYTIRDKYNIWWDDL